MAAQRVDRDAHPEKRKAYRERAGDQIRDYMTRREATHKEERHAYHAKYQAEHRDERKAKYKPRNGAYRAEHRDVLRRKARDWARANPERNRARVKA